MYIACNYTYRNRNAVCKNFSRSILEVYLISRLQKYIWKYNLISAGQNTSRSINYGAMA